MSRRPTAFLAALCMTLSVATGAARAAARKVRFVIDGRPAAAIVLPNDKAPVAKAGADELVDFVKHCTGAKLPIVHEGDGLPEGVEQGVYIGDTKAARAAGVDTKQFKADGYRMLVGDHKLILIGRDRLPGGMTLAQTVVVPGGGPKGKAAASRGTYYAVLDLIEKDLGGGFLWPGELGTVYPRTRALAADLSDRAYAPPFVERVFRSNVWIRGYFETQARKLGYSDKQIKAKKRLAARYFLRRRGGLSIHIEQSHSFIHWWGMYGKSHPEYFALQPTGVRGPVAHAKLHALANPRMVKLDVGNPALKKPLIKKAKRFFQEHPRAIDFPVAINDGGTAGFSMTPESKRWDEPTAAPHRLVWAKPDGSLYHRRYHYLSDRYARFWSWIDDAFFSEMYPGKKLFAFAYGALLNAPVKAQLPDNMLIFFVPGKRMYVDQKQRRNALKQWDGWRRAGATLFFRPNIQHFGLMLPINYTHKLGDDLHHFYKSGMVGGDFDAFHHAWATQGIDHYVITRLMYNPELSVDAVVDEFCEKAFGSAARPMRRYFDLLESATNALARKGRRAHARDLARQLIRVRPQVLAAFHAADEAVPDGSVQAKRIDFFRQGYRYAQLMEKGFEAAHARAAGKISRSRYQAAVGQFKEFLKDHEHTFVVDYPELLRGPHSDRGLKNRLFPVKH